MKKLNNMKWKLLLYFAAASLFSIAGCSVFWIYFSPYLSPAELWLGLAGIILLAGLITGYLSAKGLQRNVDAVHFAIIQLNKGNLSHRVPVQDGETFDNLYQDFNRMAQYIEQRVQLLQQLGEENVMLQAQSNEAAVVEERKRLARDLHDTVSQQLFAIHMTASSLPQVKNKDAELASRLEQQLIQMSQHAQKQMRGLIAQLRPIELEGKSLQDALDAWFPDYCRQNGLQGTLDLRLDIPVSEAIEHQLFLLIQEGLANTVKHSSATSVTLTLHDREHIYWLQMMDNGKGFDPEAARTGSYGLMTMKERAEKLGGELEIRSRLGTGTWVEIRIPKFKK